MKISHPTKQLKANIDKNSHPACDINEKETKLSDDRLNSIEKQLLTLKQILNALFQITN